MSAVVARLPRATGAGLSAFLGELYPLGIRPRPSPLGDAALADADYLAAVVEDLRNVLLARLSVIDGETCTGPAVAERPATVKQLAVAGHPSVLSRLGGSAAEQLDAWANLPDCPRPLYCRALAASLRRLL
jgi:hypothetical protein